MYLYAFDEISIVKAVSLVCSFDLMTLGGMMLRLALKQSVEMLTPPWNLNLQKLVYHNKTNQVYRVFKLISFGHNKIYVLALLFKKSVLWLFKNMIGFDGQWWCSIFCKFISRGGVWDGIISAKRSQEVKTISVEASCGVWGPSKLYNNYITIDR